MPNIRRRVIKLLLVGSFLAWFILFLEDDNSGLVPSNPSLTAVRKNYGSCITENPLSTMFDKDDTIGLGNCSFHWGSSTQNVSGSGPSRDKIQDTIANWQYDKRVSKLSARFAGKRVLDVGMGQGPWGAALLGKSPTMQYYIGLDPAVCPPSHARTRDPNIPRGGKMLQCIKAYGTHDIMDPRIVECIGKNKYHSFPITGIQMMQAYPGRLALLPGTFETLNPQLSRIVFDYAMLITVTEHLDQLRSVIEGLWAMLGKCSQSAEILIDHHNYYSYNGHHGYPRSAKEMEANMKPEMLELADWGHIQSDASVASDKTLNRVRPGDLQALVNVYFDCTCFCNRIPEDEVARMTAEKFQHFARLGFEVQRELFARHIHMDCKRRLIPVNPAILDNLDLFHPPMDGLYRAQPMMNCPLSYYGKMTKSSYSSKFVQFRNYVSRFKMK